MRRYSVPGKQQRFARYAAQQLFCLLPSAFCLLLLSGCIHRSLTVKTDPPGAMVYVNDQLKGESPLTYDFVWYGWHRVLLRKDGYERVEERKELRAPVYFWIPVDLVMELLPFQVRDPHTWSYALTPSANPASPMPPQFLRSNTTVPPTAGEDQPAAIPASEAPEAAGPSETSSSDASSPRSTTGAVP